MSIVQNCVPDILRSMDCVLRVYKEKIPENGEDSYCYDIREDALLLGVFDGCGGSGAKRYRNYREKTGAYIAARATAGAVQEWFENCNTNTQIEEQAQEIQQIVKKALHFCKEKSGRQGKTKLRGSMAKEFPTTAAIAYCVPESETIVVNCFWAGDSRVYILNEDGLAQITYDDLDGLDAFENISADGVLTNVISATKPFVIHSTRLVMQKPFLIFAASDGCFGYIRTPMEFEAYIIEHLLKSKCLADFERSVHAGLEEIAGDDYSMVGAAFGFGTYSSLQDSLKQRFRLLVKRYAHPLKNASDEKIKKLWNGYKENYYRYLAKEEEENSNST